MAVIGSLYPGTVHSIATAPYNGIDWVATSIVNIRADDTAYASIVAPQYDEGVISYLLLGRSFGATVPTGGTINGFVVEIGKWFSAGSARDAIVTLYDGSIIGSNLGSTGIAWPSTIGTISYGGSTNKWGITPTPAQVNGTGFGVGIAAVASADNTDVWVDFVRLSIYYDAPQGTTYNATAAENNQVQVSDAAAPTYYYPTYNVTVAEAAQAQVFDASTFGVIHPLAGGENNQAQVFDAAAVSFSAPATYSPQTGILDDFNRADENPLNPALWDGPFTDGQGLWKIVSNQAVPVG